MTCLAHEVCDARLLVVVELEEALAPLLPVEVLDLLELLQVAQLVLEAAVALPRHHPHVPPLVPQRLRARVLDALLLLRHRGPAANGEERALGMLSKESCHVLCMFIQVGAKISCKSI